MVPDAVFFIKYLRTLGFSATNDILQKMPSISEMRLFERIIRIYREVSMKPQNILEIFLRNLLLDEKHELHNRDLHIIMKKVRFCSKMRI